MSFMPYAKLFRKKRGSYHRCLTQRKGHWRKPPSGLGRVWVERHQMHVNKVHDFLPRLNFTNSHSLSLARPEAHLKSEDFGGIGGPFTSSPSLPLARPFANSLKKTAINNGLALASKVFPEYATLIAGGKYLFLYKKEINSAMEIMFSSTPISSKLEAIAKLATNVAISETKGAVASSCAKELVTIIDSQDGFSNLSNKLNIESSSETEFKNFFQSNVKELISNAM